jgi:glucose-1-phosphatase
VPYWAHTFSLRNQTNSLVFKNLIFDLGGVLVDVDVQHTVAAFARLSGKTDQEIVQSYQKYPQFFAYERGELSDAEFRIFVQQVFSFQAADDVIDAAWNAMITGLPEGSLKMLEMLKQHYALAVLSNTNQIHLDYINQRILPRYSSHSSLNHYFHKHYYSHLVGKRKPEPEIYLQVLEENAIDPATTLFLDDRIENIAAAKALGIQTKLVHHPDEVFDFFNA